MCQRGAGRAASCEGTGAGAAARRARARGEGGQRPHGRARRDAGNRVTCTTVVSCIMKQKFGPEANFALRCDPRRFNDRSETSNGDQLISIASGRRPLLRNCEHHCSALDRCWGLLRGGFTRFRQRPWHTSASFWSRPKQLSDSLRGRSTLCARALCATVRAVCVCACACVCVLRLVLFVAACGLTGALVHGEPRNVSYPWLVGRKRWS